MWKLLLLLLFLLPQPARASTVSYLFSGDGGLSGSFTLCDELVRVEPIVFGPQPAAPTVGMWWAYESLLNSMSGQIGSIPFNGIPKLYITEMYDNDILEDSWILRLPLYGSGFGDGLNLFIYSKGSMANALTPVIRNGMVPQYSFRGEDRKTVSGHFIVQEAQSQAEITTVPEPHTLLLLCSGMGVLILMFKHADR